jgi:alkylhydroperoxidase/carboxymuconolactone decarboxylase family protein YurZ
VPEVYAGWAALNIAIRAGMDLRRYELVTLAMDLAERVVSDPRGIAEEDVAALRDLGLSDHDVLHVVLAAAARCFFSTVLDALGVEPDASYRTTLPPDLLELLTVGRPPATP